MHTATNWTEIKKHIRSSHMRNPNKAQVFAVVFADPRDKDFEHIEVLIPRFDYYSGSGFHFYFAGYKKGEGGPGFDETKHLLGEDWGFLYSDYYKTRDVIQNNSKWVPSGNISVLLFDYALTAHNVVIKRNFMMLDLALMLQDEVIARPVQVFESVTQWFTRHPTARIAHYANGRLPALLLRMFGNGVQEANLLPGLGQALKAGRHYRMLKARIP